MKAQDESAALYFWVFATGGIVGPHPPMQRGMKMVVDEVKRAGHTVFYLIHRGRNGSL